MFSLTQHSTSAELSVFIEVITALGIIWLGVMFFRLLHKVDSIISFIALILYLIESGLLVISRIWGYRLIQVSAMYATNNEESAKISGKTLLCTKDYFGNLALIAFGFGAILFYCLLLKNKMFPAWIAFWGLVTTIPLIIICLLIVCGINVPAMVEILILPYAPFEFFLGSYVLAKGIKLPCNVENGVTTP
jgi:hypothetical protein